MRAGDLRHPITIQTNTPTRNSVGDEVDSWSTFASVRAKIEPLRGREYHEAKAINIETAYRFVMWYVAATEDMRILDEDSNIYDIQSVLHDSKSGKQHTEIMAIWTNKEAVVVVPSTDVLLLETGDQLLLETGDALLLE